jgi:hypothetical protein
MFLFSEMSSATVRAHSASCASGTRATSLRSHVSRACVAECPLLSSSEVMNEWSCNSSPAICLHVVYRDIFYHLPYLILNNRVITLNMKVFCTVLILN